MGAMDTAYTLRPASAKDRDFVFLTYKIALRRYVEWAWGWDEAFQRAGFWRHHPIAQLQIIQVHSRNAGVLHMEEHGDCHHVRTIFLHPEHQRQRIGCHLLAAEIQRARSNGKALQLKVIKVNPAKRLYERLGFEVTGEDEATYLMRAA